MSKKDKQYRKGYKVGYGKPPAYTQFKPGHSGNPRGRPKDVQDPETLLRKAVNKKTIVKVQGQHRKLSKLELACTQLANKSASGDTRSILSVLRLLGVPRPKIEVPKDVEEQERMVAEKLTTLSDEELETLSKVLGKLGLGPSGGTN